MTDGTDLSYYRRREAQERTLAARAGDMMARRLHLDLAERYARLVQIMTPVDAPAAA